MQTSSMRRAALGLAAVLFVAGCQREALEIRVEGGPDARVLIAIRDTRGALVRTLETERAGPLVTWDALDAQGSRVAPGEYSAAVILHRTFGLRPSGAIGAMKLPQDRPAGAPIGVVADGERMFLAWSGGQIAACDLEGNIEWAVALPESAGCAALAIDGSRLVALASPAPPCELEQFLVRLDLADGHLLRWPLGDKLPVVSLWPADAEARPTSAGAIAARAGHIYLTFPELHFLSVISGETGAYLETIIGPSPSIIDVVATKTRSPLEPEKLIAADFAVIALGAGAFGKVLLAHDPLWVIGSDAQQLEPGELISAFALLGDDAPHLPRSLFMGISAPYQQVERRDLLEPQGYVWVAGQSGGRAARGPWQPEAFGPVKALAVDARGRLWIAESDACPPRFSVWTTGGTQGHLEREIFGPLDPRDQGAALFPGRPDIVVGGGCEWRIKADGAAECLGVITRDGCRAATFFADAKGGGVQLRIEQRDGKVATFIRRGDGDYAPSADAPVAMVSTASEGRLRIQPVAGSGWRVSTADGLALGTVALPTDLPKDTALSPAERSADGRTFVLTAGDALGRFEITGIESIHRASPQRLRVLPPRR